MEKGKIYIPGKMVRMLQILALIPLALFLVILPAQGQSSLEVYSEQIHRLPPSSMVRNLSMDAYDKRNENVGEAIQLSEEAVAVAKKEGNMVGMIFNHRLLGSLYHRTQQFEEAVNHYEQCITYAQLRKDSVTLRECYLNEGTIFLTRGLNNKALDYFLQALNYSEYLDKEKEYISLGAVFYMEGEYEEAYKYYGKALEILEKKDDTYSTLVVYLNMGDVFKMMQRYDVALTYYNDILSHKDAELYPELTLICHNHIGFIHSVLHEPEQAMRHFKKALEIGNALDDELILSRTLFLMGEMLFKNGQFREAKPYLQRTLDISTKFALYSEMSASSHYLQQIFENEGDYKQAYGFANVHKLASDSLRENEAKSEVLKLMFDYQLNLKDIERHNQHELDLSERRKSTLRLYTVIFILISISLAAILLTFRFVQRSKINRIENEKANLKVTAVQKDLELRNLELVGKALKITETDELIDLTIVQLNEFSNTLPKVKKDELETIIRRIKSNKVEDQWEQFYYYFSQVYAQFYDRLEQDFPDLTLNEKRLCALLKLNMTTKDIASLTYQNAKSVEVARTRLRKKLNLTNSNLTLQEFLIQYD